MLAIAIVTFCAPTRAESPANYGISNLNRLSAALDRITFPEQGPTKITVWLQGGGEGTSATLDRQILDLTTVVKTWSNNLNDVDLANVAVLRSDGKSIQFVDMQEFLKSDKPTGIPVKRGDLVALLRR
ncbi:MAG TPA: hypothetical protein VL175_19725 [Pirellulales bacterium]|nr:hypothetical protein [Pirellulales bacterium]